MHSQNAIFANFAALLLIGSGLPAQAQAPVSPPIPSSAASQAQLQVQPQVQSQVQLHAQSQSQSQSGKQAPVGVSIVYTGNTSGVYAAWSALNEAGPLFSSDGKGDVSAQGLEYDPGTLRHERWYLWSAGQPLTAKSARALFETDGVRLAGPGRLVPALVSDYAVVFQQPDGEADWLVPWLDAKLREEGKLPDVSLSRGTLYQARSASGEVVWIMSLDGSPPPAAALRDANSWHWVGGIHARVVRGKRQSEMVSLARRFGGYPLHDAVRRAVAERGALRVDAGNLVDDLNETFSAEAIADTFAELPRMGLDALVPFKYELRLPPDLQTRLAAAVPLVAANLTAPPGVSIKPYVLREVGGVRIAIVGIADVPTLTQFGFLGTRSGWQGEDGEKALTRALKDIRLDGADAIVLVTNVADDKLPPLRDACTGCAAILTRTRQHPEFVFKERFEPVDPARTRSPQPWIVAGAGGGTYGILDLEFRPAPPAYPGGPAVFRLTAASNEGRVVADDLSGDPDKNWRSFELISDFVEARREAIVPDIRKLAAKDKRFTDKEGRPLMVYDSERWSRLAAAIIRQATGAELSIGYLLHGGSHIVGEVPLFVAEDWMPVGSRVALAHLTGAEIKRLMATDPERSRFVAAGFDPEKGVVGGRPIVDAERYLVATFDDLAGNESYQTIFHDPSRRTFRLKGERLVPGKNGDTVTVRDIVLARLVGMKSRHGEFSAEYLDELISLIGDDGLAFSPRWSVALKPAEGTFQQLSVTNRDAFGGVRNSRVNTPNNTSARGKANVALTYETADLDWENKALLEYQRAEIQTSKGPLVQESNDNIQLTSEFRLKVFRLQTQKSALELVPFVNGNYLTEFTPTEDPKTNQPNPRRQEVGGIAGVVLYPGTWLKEVRLGAIAKHDLAIAAGGFEPGVQLAGAMEYPLGPLTWSAEVDLKNYFRTAEDTADDLGLLGQITTGFRFPLFGGFSLRLGVDAFVFTGKLGAAPPLGSSIVPSVGLTYTGTFKPALGLVY